MFGSTEAVTMNLTTLALDAASMRHLALANNIANANTAGYAPASVNFEQQLGAARAALAEGRPLQTSMLRGVQPVLLRSAPAAEPDRTAALDAEVAAMAENTVHYQALLKGLNKHLSILSAAISEGKR